MLAIPALPNAVVIRVLALAWLHARRQYFKAQDSDLAGATVAMAYIRRLHHVERQAKELFKEQQNRPGARPLGSFDLGVNSRSRPKGTPTRWSTRKARRSSNYRPAGFLSPGSLCRNGCTAVGSASRRRYPYSAPKCFHRRPMPGIEAEESVFRDTVDARIPGYGGMSVDGGQGRHQEQNALDPARHKANRSSPYRHHAARGGR